MDKPYEIESTFFSDGTRSITIKYKSYEGERYVLAFIEMFLELFFDKRGRL